MGQRQADLKIKTLIPEGKTRGDLYFPFGGRTDKAITGFKEQKVHSVHFLKHKIAQIVIVRKFSLCPFTGKYNVYQIIFIQLR